MFSGELDFWIDGHLEWAIELLIDGSEKKEHIRKMADDYSVLKPSHSRIIDFRKNKACRNPFCDMYVAVNIAEDFSSAEVTFFGPRGVRSQSTIIFH